jgi:hypothetical protein
MPSDATFSTTTSLNTSPPSTDSTKPAGVPSCSTMDPPVV